MRFLIAISSLLETFFRWIFPRQSRFTSRNTPPEVLVPNDDLFEALANCYEFCRSQSAALANAIRIQAPFAQLHRTMRDEMNSVIENDGIRAVIPLLRAQNETEYLVRVASLLRAIEALICTTGESDFGQIKSSERLGATEYYLTRRPDSIVDLVGEPDLAPRTHDEISDDFTKFHWWLSFVPLQHGRWLIQTKSLHAGTNQVLVERLEAGDLRVAVSPLSATAGIVAGPIAGVFPADEQTRFVVKAIDNEPQEAAFLEDLLQHSYDQGIAILVLPELRITPHLLAIIERFLRNQSRKPSAASKGLALVIAGSWHYREQEGHVNRCFVLDHRGNLVWQHDKLAEYHITARNVKQRPQLKRQLGLNEHGGVEAIACGNALQIVNSVIGRMSVAICVGFAASEIRPLLHLSDATLFFVPAMTPDVTPLIETAEFLVRNRCATFVANCGTIGGSNEKAASFYKIPIRNMKANEMHHPHVDNRYLHVFELFSLLKLVSETNS